VEHAKAEHVHADVVPGADGKGTRMYVYREWGMRCADGFSGLVGPAVYDRFFRMGHAAGVRNIDN